MIRVSDQVHQALAAQAARNRRSLTAELDMILDRELVEQREGGKA